MFRSLSLNIHNTLWVYTQWQVSVVYTWAAEDHNYEWDCFTSAGVYSQTECSLTRPQLEVHVSEGAVTPGAQTSVQLFSKPSHPALLTRARWEGLGLRLEKSYLLDYTTTIYTVNKVLIFTSGSLWGRAGTNSAEQHHLPSYKASPAHCHDQRPSMTPVSCCCFLYSLSSLNNC